MVSRFVFYRVGDMYLGFVGNLTWQYPWASSEFFVLGVTPGFYATDSNPGENSLPNMDVRAGKSRKQGLVTSISFVSAPTPASSTAAWSLGDCSSANMQMAAQRSTEYFWRADAALKICWRRPCALRRSCHVRRSRRQHMAACNV